MPTLLVWQRFDPYFPLRQIRRAAGLLPRAELAVLPGYGHAPHKHNTGAFLRVLRSYLGR